MGIALLDSATDVPWAWAGHHRLPPTADGDSIGVRTTGYYVVLEARRRPQPAGHLRLRGADDPGVAAPLQRAPGAARAGRGAGAGVRAGKPRGRMAGAPHAHPRLLAGAQAARAIPDPGLRRLALGPGADRGCPGS